MIISASYRTDIPAFYGRWFLARLAAGEARVVNPYGGRPYRVSLHPADVDGFVFWTRNPAPFGEGFAAVAERRHPFVVQMTVTGYPRALDTGTIAADVAVAQVRDLAARYGRRAVVWRYDPVLTTSLTPPDWHRVTFARLAAALAGHVDEVVVSFAQVYRKTARNTAAAATRHGFEWWDPPVEEKRGLLGDLAAIAAGHGLKPSLCAQRDLLVDGLADAACIDADRLADIAGRPVPARRKPHRKACGCWQSQDIGAYDSCPQGCVYCYAVGSRDRAKRVFAAHDPAAPFLAPPKPSR